jgi:hypothetical protein
MLLIYNTTKNIRLAFNEGVNEIYINHLMTKNACFSFIIRQKNIRLAFNEGVSEIYIHHLLGETPVFCCFSNMMMSYVFVCLFTLLLFL